MVIALFGKQDRITAADVSRVLGLSDRQVRDLIRRWVGDGWLLTADPAKRSRAYELSAEYRRFIGVLSADDPENPAHVGQAGSLKPDA